MDKTDVKRVRDELRAAGVGTFGLRVPEAKAIAKILNPDEHIGGVVYGTYSAGLAWLIATNQRVIFMDRKPLFNSMDELSYDAVSGVKSTRAGLFTSVLLHTRAGNYVIRFANAKCANIFTRYIESKRLGLVPAEKNTKQALGAEKKSSTEYKNFSPEGLEFLKGHDLAVLSTVDRSGNVHGAVIYYTIDQNDYVYILTKSETGKGRNVYAHSQVALTVYEAGTMQTVQLQGIAEIETDQAKKESVFEQMIKPRLYRDGSQLPPLTKMHEGTYLVIKIAPTLLSYHDYAKAA